MMVISDEQKPRILAVLLSHELVRPSPFMFGDLNPRKEAAIVSFWREIEVEAVARWATEHPGTRPSAWWFWTAPEALRQQVGGSGRPTTSGRLALTAHGPPGRNPRYRDVALGDSLPDYQGTWRALPLFFIDADPADPPVFEAEAACLRRHHLLSVAEARRLTEADFRPVALRIAGGNVVG